MFMNIDSGGRGSSNPRSHPYNKGSDTSPRFI